MKKSIKLLDNLCFVGAFHRGLKIFDVSMPTPFGTSYNSYLLKGKKYNVLIETVNEILYDELTERINDCLGPNENIDYIIHNHTESDHGGSSYLLVEKYPNAKIIATEIGVEILKEIGKENFEKTEFLVPGKDIQKLDIGGYTLEFFKAPMLHWPDTMFTYVPEIKSIFTCDFLGTHYCYRDLYHSKFDKKGKEYEDYKSTYKFYFDCVMSPHSKFVIDGCEIIKKLKKERGLEYVWTGHGPILDENIDEKLELYEKWASEVLDEQKTRFKPGVSIIFVSAYTYTTTMAKKIAEGIESQGLPVKLIDAVNEKEENIHRFLNEYKGVLLGTPTIGSDALSPIWNIAVSLNPTVNKRQFSGAFGSYGFSGEGPQNIHQRLKMCKMNVPLEPLMVKFRPSKNDLEKCKEFGEEFAKYVKGEKKI